MNPSLALAAILVLAAPAHAEPRAITVLPAFTAIAAGDALALWAPDLRSVLGYDAAGKRLWRVATGDQGGARDLEVLPDGEPGGEGHENVLVYAGSEAIVIGARSGLVLGRRPGVVLDRKGRGGGCRVVHAEGACALACECGFEAVSCSDLATLGERATLPAIESIDEDGVRSERCAMYAHGIVGRSEDVVVMAVPDATDGITMRTPVVARELGSGRELWRSDALGFIDEDLSGVLGGGLCYAGSRAGVAVFDCRAGTVLWQRSLHLREGDDAQIERAARGLFVRDESGAHLFGARTGGALWEVPVPSGLLALLADDTIAPSTRVMREAIGGARILAAATGKTLRDLTWSGRARRSLLRLRAGWAVQSPDDLAVYDGNGQALYRLDRKSPDKRTRRPLGGTFAGDGADTAIWDRAGVSCSSFPDGVVTPIDAAGARIVGFEGGLGAGVVALMIDGKTPWDPKDPATFGELRLFRL